MNVQPKIQQPETSPNSYGQKSVKNVLLYVFITFIRVKQLFWGEGLNPQTLILNIAYITEFVYLKGSHGSQLKMIY